jgi:hypothetical protein
MHIDLLFKNTMEECILNIQLMKMLAFGHNQ